MLVSLTIQHFLLIDQLTIHTKHGLSVITGETGAGKSILLDALGSCLGSRVQGGLVKAGQNMAHVTAVFELHNKSPIVELLREQGIEPDDALRLRRVIYADGKSKAFINDTPVTQGLLKAIGSRLIEVHSQHAASQLMEPIGHRYLIDRLGGHTDLLSQTAKSWEKLHHLHLEKQKLADLVNQSLAAQDYDRHVTKELEELNLEEGEVERLQEERRTLMEEEKQREAYAQALTDLTKDGDLSRGCYLAERSLARLNPKEHGDVTKITGYLQDASSALQEAIALLETSLAAFHEADIDRIESRLAKLQEIARKHRTTPEALCTLLESLRTKLYNYDHAEEELVKIEQTLEQAREGYRHIAMKLREARKKAAGKLEDLVLAECPPLKMERAQFVVSLEELDPGGWGSTGMDRIEFLATMNPGSPLAPLKDVASGGEMSRFMLALTMHLNVGETMADTIIFDEIDTGIGGAVADAVGKRLAKLGESRQVLVVTHQPQVASYALDHFHVQKSQSDQATSVDVIQLDAEGRTKELARMLAGEAISSEALAAAQSLMTHAMKA